MNKRLKNIIGRTKQTTETYPDLSISMYDFQYLVGAVKQKDLEIERLKLDKKILIKEITRLHNESYKQSSVVADLLKARAYIFTCSYKTAWELWLEDNEKFDFTFEEIKEYIELSNSQFDHSN